MFFFSFFRVNDYIDFFCSKNESRFYCSMARRKCLGDRLAFYLCFITVACHINPIYAFYSQQIRYFKIKQSCGDWGWFTNSKGTNHYATNGGCACSFGGFCVRGHYIYWTDGSAYRKIIGWPETPVIYPDFYFARRLAAVTCGFSWFSPTGKGKYTGRSNGFPYWSTLFHLFVNETEYLKLNN